jgi:hypothetical protein
MQNIMVEDLLNKVHDLRGLLLDTDGLSTGARRRIIEVFKKWLEDMELAYKVPASSLGGIADFDCLEISE